MDQRLRSLHPHPEEQPVDEPPAQPTEPSLGSVVPRLQRQKLGGVAAPAGPTPAAVGPAAATEAAAGAEATTAATAAPAAAGPAAPTPVPAEAAAAEAAAAEAAAAGPIAAQAATALAAPAKAAAAEEAAAAAAAAAATDGRAFKKARFGKLQLDVSMGTSRGEGPDKLAVYAMRCSEVAEGLYVSGEAVAKSLQLLQENGITHVVNCAGQLYPEYFKPDGIMYKTFWLDDIPSEDIVCVLYDAFEFIDAARAAGGRVLVHCSKGVSRSTTIAIAYLMWRMSQPYDDVYNAVRAVRAICAPNIGFVQQLDEWQKRRSSPPTRVRVYRLASHCAGSPLYIVHKAVSPAKGSAFADWRALDPRGAFIVHLPGHLYVWRGSKCPEQVAEGAHRAALLIEKYEGTPAPEPVRQGEEPEELVTALQPPSASEQLHGDMPIEPSNAGLTGAGTSGMHELPSGAATGSSYSAATSAADCRPSERALAPTMGQQKLGGVGPVVEVDAYTEDYELFHKAIACTSGVAGEPIALDPTYGADSPAGAKGRDQRKRSDRAT